MEPRASGTSRYTSDDYRTRILIGFLCSLSSLLLILNLPYGTTPDPVGWTPRPQEWIPVSEVERASVTGGDRADEAGSQPSSPRHGSPEARAQSASRKRHATGAKKATSSEGNQKAKADSNRTVPVAALSTSNEPEIVGGIGSLYLHINYPYQARVKGIEGQLQLQFTVTSKGDVRNIEVTKSLHPLCDSAAIEGLRSVQFRPAERKGEAIPVRMKLPIRFELQSDTDPARNSRRSASNG